MFTFTCTITDMGTGLGTTDPALADDEDDDLSLPSRSGSGRNTSGPPRRKAKNGGIRQIPSWSRAVAVPAILLMGFLAYRLLHPGVAEP